MAEMSLTDVRGQMKKTKEEKNGENQHVDI